MKRRPNFPSVWGLLPAPTINPFRGLSILLNRELSDPTTPTSRRLIPRHKQCSLPIPFYHPIVHNTTHNVQRHETHSYHRRRNSRQSPLTIPPQSLHASPFNQKLHLHNLRSLSKIREDISWRRTWIGYEWSCGP